MLICSHTGSGSTYIYGYCDANFKKGMDKEKCIDFVKNCKFMLNNTANYYSVCTCAKGYAFVVCLSKTQFTLLSEI